jgi:hypothetical protein
VLSRRYCLATGSALLLGLALLATPSAARQSTPTYEATPAGVGPVHLDSTVSYLHRRHLIGHLRPGCELDPGQRVAPLRSPLSGFAIFSRPRNRVASLAITGGASTVKGISVGSTPREAREAYPRAHYDPPGTLRPFAEGFIWVNKPLQAKLTFTVDPETRLISALSVPAPSFCE